jgi:hypothetical protein
MWSAGGESMSQWGYIYESPSPCGATGAGSYLLMAGLKATPAGVLGIANI